MKVAPQLAEAFETFVEVSGQMTRAYRDLEARVVCLTAELEAAQGEARTRTTQAVVAHERLATVLAALPAGLVVLDGAGRIEIANPAAHALLDTPLEACLWRDVIPRAFAPRPDDGEDISLKDGRTVRVNTSPRAGATGQILLIHDTTAARAAELRLRRMERLSSLGEMAARLAHQIRTPLSAALLYCGQLARTGPGARIADSLRSIERMMNDMLLFARGPGPDVGRVPAMGLLRTVAGMFEARAASQAAVIEIEMTTDEVEVCVSQTALLGALGNLVENALDCAGKQAAHIRLAVTPTDDGTNVLLTVTDNGPGVTAEARARLFEPFFTTRARGTGLGLAVVRAVAEAHGGEAWCADAMGGGCRFGITLPRARQAVGALSLEVAA